MGIGYTAWSCQGFPILQPFTSLAQEWYDFCFNFPIFCNHKEGIQPLFWWPQVYSIKHDITDVKCLKPGLILAIRKAIRLKVNQSNNIQSFLLRNYYMNLYIDRNNLAEWRFQCHCSNAIVMTQLFASAHIKVQPLIYVFLIMEESSVWLGETLVSSQHLSLASAPSFGIAYRLDKETCHHVGNMPISLCYRQ